MPDLMSMEYHVKLSVKKYFWDVGNEEEDGGKESHEVVSVNVPRFDDLRIWIWIEEVSAYNSCHCYYER